MSRRRKTRRPWKPYVLAPPSRDDGDKGARVLDKDGREVGARAADVIEIEAVDDDANGRKRKRRVELIVVMLRNGTLTLRQARMAEVFRDAYEATETSPAPGERIGGTKDPERATIVKLDAWSWLARLEGMLPPASKDVVRKVCRDGVSLPEGRARYGALWHLHAGLDAVAWAVRM